MSNCLRIDPDLLTYRVVLVQVDGRVSGPEAHSTWTARGPRGAFYPRVTPCSEQ